MNADTPPVSTPDLTPPPYVQRLPQSSSLGEPLPLDELTDWVRANQYLAMVGVFAFGVFLGILARR